MNKQEIKIDKEKLIIFLEYLLNKIENIIKTKYKKLFRKIIIII